MIKRLFIGAFTGTAAFNIRGSTLHKFLSMTRKRKTNNKTQNSRIMQSKWKDVDHFIIDEVSFIEQWVLNKSHKSLMIAKNSNNNFGGINILFCGDFCQLPLPSS
jgi:ATP-dependent DNA helicase PIF1